MSKHTIRFVFPFKRVARAQLDSLTVSSNKALFPLDLCISPIFSILIHHHPQFHFYDLSGTGLFMISGNICSQINRLFNRIQSFVTTSCCHVITFYSFFLRIFFCMQKTSLNQRKHFSENWNVYAAIGFCIVYVHINAKPPPPSTQERHIPEIVIAVCLTTMGILKGVLWV